MKFLHAQKWQRSKLLRILFSYNGTVTSVEQTPAWEISRILWNRKAIAVFTINRHWFLSCARLILSTLGSHYFMIHFNNILCLPIVTSCMYFWFPTRVILQHHRPWFIAPTKLGKNQKLWFALIHIFPSPITSPLLGPNISLSNLNLYHSQRVRN
jgi:hypothetical protein